METKKLSINELIPAEYNPRKDLQKNDPEYISLKRSIEEFGYVSPIIVNKQNNKVIGGHQRLKVLKELGYEEIDVVLVDFDEQHEKLLNISLNKLGGEFDLDLLGLVIQDIQEKGYDATLTGFNMDQIDDLVGNFDPLMEEGVNDGNEDSNEVEDPTVMCPKCQYVGMKEDFKT